MTMAIYLDTGVNDIVSDSESEGGSNEEVQNVADTDVGVNTRDKKRTRSSGKRKNQKRKRRIPLPTWVPTHR